MKKGTGKGIIQLALSILIMVLFQLFYFKVLGFFGLHFSGMAYEIADLVRYVIVAVMVFIIYSGSIKSGRSKFNNSLLNSVIYAIACFIVLILITIGIHTLVNKFSSFTHFCGATAIVSCSVLIHSLYSSVYSHSFISA